MSGIDKIEAIQYSLGEKQQTGAQMLDLTHTCPLSHQNIVLNNLKTHTFVTTKIYFKPGKTKAK